jgi:hypothetical protein
MAEYGQMTGAVLDGRLTFDRAISRAPATTKQLAAKVAGDADMLIVSDCDAGNCSPRRSAFGRRILARRRDDHPRTRIASCAVAARDAHAGRVAADFGKSAGSERCARILDFNAGSSSIKISVFETAADRSYHLGADGERSKPSSVARVAGAVRAERQ